MTEVFQRTYARVSVRERTERSASRASNEPENGRAVRRLQAEVLLISAAVFVVDADRTGSSAVTDGVPGGAFVWTSVRTGTHPAREPANAERDGRKAAASPRRA